MPWKECHVVDERLRFIARLLDGETDGGGVRGFRNFPQDRLQDLPAVQGCRRARAHRPQPTAVSPRQSACDGRGKS